MQNEKKLTTISTENENRKGLKKVFTRITEPTEVKKVFTRIMEPTELKKVFTKIEESTKAAGNNVAVSDEVQEIFEQTHADSMKKVFQKMRRENIPSKGESEDVQTTNIVENRNQKLPQIQTATAIVENEEKINFKIEILEKIIKIDEMEVGRMQKKIFFRCAVKMDTGEQYIEVVAADKLKSLNWIAECSEGEALLDLDGKARATVVKMLVSCLKQKKYHTKVEYCQNGWKKINNRWQYVIDSGIIGKVQTTVTGDKTHPFMYEANWVGTPDVFLQAIQMKEICKDNSVTTLLLLYTYMAVLEKVFELAGFPVKGVLSVIGPTNSRKTSLALCMTKTFCRENIFTPEISFESTRGGIEVESSKHADSVLLIDDFHPAISKANASKLLDTLEFILRRYGDRVGKKRMTDFAPSAKTGKYDVSGLCVVTGEDIGGVQSSMTRTLVLEIARDCVDNDLLAFYQQNPYILTTSLYDFIAFVSQFFNELVDMSKECIRSIRNEKKCEIPRFAEYAAQFLTTARIIGKYAEWRGFWHETDIQQWIVECESSVETIVQKNLILVRREDFATLIVQALNSALDEYEVMDVKRIQCGKIGCHVILFDFNYYYISTDFLIEIARKFWMRLGKDLPFSSRKQLTQFLDQSGLILVRKEGDEVRRTLPLPGSKRRVLYIKREKMKQLLEEVEV